MIMNIQMILLIIILIIITLIILLFIMYNYNVFNVFNYNPEAFYNYLESKVDDIPSEPVNDFESEGGSYKDLEKDTGKIKPATGSCKDDTDPASLCLTYDSCCNGVNNNCLCKNPIIKDCVRLYEDCIENRYLSEKNMEYLGNSNKHKVCQNILKNCCNVVKDIKINNTYNKVTMKTGDDTNKLCEISGGSIDMCKNMCNLDKSCKGYIYNNFSKDCTIYSGQFKDRPIAYKNADKNYDQYIKEGFTSGDGMDICKNYESQCMNTGKLDGNVNACICKHPITQDCKTQYALCLNKDIEGLDKTLKKEYCNNMFGACCQAINNIDVSERFKYEDPVGGGGMNSNLICHQEDNNLNLQECQKRCTNNPDCTFIDTNTGLSKEVLGDSSLYCGLYKGSPNSISSNATMKVKVSGKTIYKKKEITEKDKIKAELDSD